MTNRLLKIAMMFIAALGFSCSSDKDFILNETFDKNDIGWVEENTGSHELEIRGGKYYIHCKDTTHTQSSSGPLDLTILTGWPKKYVISSSVDFIEGELKNEFGIILVSPSLQYRFSIYMDGQLEVLVYDHNSDKQIALCSEKMKKFSYNDVINFAIIVDGKSFKYRINDKVICEGEFNTKQWVDLRLFASSTSRVEFDYLTVQAMSKN